MTVDDLFGQRMERVRASARAAGVDAVLTSVGADTPWLCGYEAMPLERLTMLVVPTDGPATLVVPGLEAARVVERPDAFATRPWAETEDPIALVAELVGSVGTLAIGDRTWTRFTLDLQKALPNTRFTSTAPVVGRLRAIKDAAEVEALAIASAAADRVADQLRSGDISLIGRTEAEVSADIGQRLLDEGHHRVNFAIVAAGENAASPHHEPGTRVIEANEGVLCDFGGTYLDPVSGVGYCSDITRCVWTGEPPAEIEETYGILLDAQQHGVSSAVVGAECQTVDRETRARIVEGGLGEYFIHRTGHGIGVEEHEDPYMVEGNKEILVPGHAFSVEPGVYLPGRFGFRIEDIVVATIDGPRSLNSIERDLARVG